MKIKKGDLVKVEDNSFSIKVEGGEFKEGLPGGVCNEESPIFKVIATDMKLPLWEHFLDYEKPEEIVDRFGYNNTIIKNIENGKLYFIRSDQLHLAKKKDELEPGDKFKTNTGSKVKVLCVDYDGYHKEVAYFVKYIGNVAKGLCMSITASAVKEIIYD